MTRLEAVTEKVHNGYYVDLFVRASNAVAINMYTKVGSSPAGFHATTQLCCFSAMASVSLPSVLQGGLHLCTITPRTARVSMSSPTVAQRSAWFYAVAVFADHIVHNRHNEPSEVDPALRAAWARI